MEELLNLFPKDPYEVNEAVAKILPQITHVIGGRGFNARLGLTDFFSSTV